MYFLSGIIMSLGRSVNDVETFLAPNSGGLYDLQSQVL